MWSVFRLPQSGSGHFTRTAARMVSYCLFAAFAIACNPTSDNTSQANRSPDDLHYTTNPARYPVGIAISANLLQSRTTLSNISISPSLPAGLAFNAANGTITGTPTTITPSQTYTVRASNGGGTGYVQLVLAATDVPPTITYAGLTTLVGTVGTLFTTITPTLGGGALDSCTSSATLPAGLSLSGSCVISGTPTSPAAQTVYTISANNSGGSATIPFTITVKDVAPSITVGGPYTFYRGIAITPVAVTNSGGAVTSCTVSPAIPAGLSLSNTCTISGTPTANTANTSYTLTANNSSGTPSTASVTFGVLEPAPSISYSPASAVLIVGTPMTDMTPTNSGGTIVSCSVSPALPAGLSLNTTTCKISGTPTTPVSSTGYTVTATNSTASSNATVTLTVKDTPPSISYTGSPFVYTKGTAISALTPSNSGGAVTACSSTPALPAGLSISSTCVITGTPTAVTAAQNYTVTATNSSGTSSSATINITVRDATPALAYTGTPFIFTKGTSVGTITPTNSGGPPASCTVNPSLPTGLSLSSACVITGTPSVVASATNYAITGTNTGGNNVVVINVTVNDNLPVFSYAGTPFTFTKNSAIISQTPTNTGGAITSCAASPTLPAGLSLSNTCVLSGTPSVAQAATTYTITGTNSAGSASTSVSIKVNETIPVISYVGSPYTFTLNMAIASQTPTNTGGAATSCTSAPALPTGLSISSTCVISGTPTVTAATQNYVITATNGAGSGTATISITVNDTGPAINYIPSTYNFTYTKGTAISALTPNNTGGAITGCTAAPTLPPGLSIAATTCSITGTPTAVSVATSYTVTATNTGGSSSAVIMITVNDTPPVISYAGTPYAFPVSTAITNKTPTNTGGAIAGCTISPSLPPGLALSSNCVLSGTPNTITPSANYTITASNSGGTSSVLVPIAVNDNPPTLNYTGSPFTYTIGVAITNINPTLGGGAVVSCSSSPVLPAGLSISNGCVISGTPSAVTATQTYMITATNTGGSANKTISITVNNGPPILSYSGSPFTYYKGTPITTLNPTNTGGAITSCGSSPALPAGLSLSSTCVLSGTPSALSAATAYTITATNGLGSSNAIINMTVNDSAPLISFSPSSYTEVLRTTITTITPSNGGGAITNCTSSPALPAGLSLSTTTCAITGSPTAISGATGYMITASNGTGSSTTTVTVQVKDQPQILFYGLTALNGLWNSTIPGSQNVWKASVDGVDRVALTSNSNASLDSAFPAFSADGTKVLFSSNRATNGSNNGTATGSANIWTAAPDGTTPTILTSNTNTLLDSDDPPRFSPDGTKIVFASKMSLNGLANGTRTQSYNIWIMNSDGTGKFALTQNTSTGYDSIQPVFSGGSVVYFSSLTDPTTWDGPSNTVSYNIFKVNTDGTALTRLTTETGGTTRHCTQPRVSPDGSTIVYTSRSRIGGTTPPYNNIWRMTNTGANKVALTTNTSGSQDSKDPDFSPDGTEIVFSSMQNVYGGASSSYNIWKMSSAGASQTPLTQNTTSAGKDSNSPVFSPDNLKIVFSSKMDVGVSPASSYNIWVINSNGTGSVTAVTSNTSAGRDSYLAPGRVWFAP